MTMTTVKAMTMTQKITSPRLIARLTSLSSKMKMSKIVRLMIMSMKEKMRVKVKMTLKKLARIILFGFCEESALQKEPFHRF